MTTRTDFDQQLLEFLEDGTTELSGHALQSIRAGVRRTRQRVVIGPWREPLMPTFVRSGSVLAVIVAAVILGAVGLSTLPGAIPQSSEMPTAAPSATVATSPAPAPPSPAIPIVGPDPWPGPIPAGNHSSSFVWDLDFEVTFSLPTGWENRDIEVVKAAAFVSIQLVRNLYTDPCSTSESSPSVGPTVADLVAAIRADSAITTTTAVNVDVGGYSGKALSYDPAAGIDCVGEDSRLWALPADLMLPIGPLGRPEWPLRAGTHTVWVLDVNGTRLVVDASTGPNPTPALAAEVQSILDSLSIGPLSKTIAAGQCTLGISGQRGGADPPYETVLRNAVPSELNGPIPVPFPLQPPLAWLNFTGDGWQAGRGAPGGFRIIPPEGVETSGGFTTYTPVNGYQGSWVFDAPGTWWVKFTGDASRCVRQLPVIVRPLPAPA